MDEMPSKVAPLGRPNGAPVIAVLSALPQFFSQVMISFNFIPYGRNMLIKNWWTLVQIKSNHSRTYRYFMKGLFLFFIFSYMSRLKSDRQPHLYHCQKRPGLGDLVKNFLYKISSLYRLKNYCHIVQHTVRSIAQWLSIEWSHFHVTFLSRDSIVRATLFSTKTVPQISIAQSLVVGNRIIVYPRLID